MRWLLDGEVSGPIGPMGQQLGVGASLKQRSGRKTGPYSDSLLKGQPSHYE